MNTVIRISKDIAVNVRNIESLTRGYVRGECVTLYVNMVSGHQFPLSRDSREDFDAKEIEQAIIKAIEAAC